MDKDKMKEKTLKSSNYGFILTRHVNSVSTNYYWNHSVYCLNRLYPTTPIVIIDDNSNSSLVKTFENLHLRNYTILYSQYPGRGELLPFYYYLMDVNMTQFPFEIAIILHDSTFLHKKIHFEHFNFALKPVTFFWHFSPDQENLQNSLRIASGLTNSFLVHSKLTTPPNMNFMPSSKWVGCFGTQCIIHRRFLQQIQAKYNLLNLVHYIQCRADRCCFERILGILFCNETNQNQHSLKLSIFGDIMVGNQWGYTFQQYMKDLKDLKNAKNPLSKKTIVKVWTSR